MLWAAVVWDPVRASMMRPNELAAELMRAFRSAVVAAGSPSLRARSSGDPTGPSAPATLAPLDGVRAPLDPLER